MAVEQLLPWLFYVQSTSVVCTNIECKSIPNQ